MTHLRSKEEIDHSEAIRKVKQKWNSCERKLTAMKNFIIVYRKALDSRIPIFNRFQSNVSKIFDEEYREWQTILKKA